MIDLWQVSFSELTCLWRQAGRTTRVCVSGKLSETANGRLKKNLGCQVFARSKISPPSGQLHCVWDNQSGLQVVQESQRQMRRHKCLNRFHTEFHNVVDICRWKNWLIKTVARSMVTISFVVYGSVFAFYKGSLLLLHTFIMYRWFHIPSQVFKQRNILQIKCNAFLDDQIGTLKKK